MNNNGSRSDDRRGGVYLCVYVCMCVSVSVRLCVCTDVNLGSYS